MSTDVTYFQSTDPNAPQLDGTIGSLIAVLDACLLTGYGTVNVSALSVTDGLATATVDAGHGFGEACVVEIVGATPAEFNGRHKITVVSATQFAFPAGAASGTASGTITAKRAPVGGWSQPFSTADKAVYRADAGNRHFLRVGPESTAVAQWTGYETMSGVDTGTGGTSVQYVWLGSGAAWTVVADQRALWFVSNAHIAHFGDLIAFDPVDDLATLIGGRSNNSGTASQPYSSWIMMVDATPAGRLIADKSGVVKNSVAQIGFAHTKYYNSSGVYGPGFGFSASVTIYAGVWAGVFATMGPLSVVEHATGMPRGQLAGVQCPIDRVGGTINDGDIVIDRAGRAWRYTVYRCNVSSTSNSGAVWLDLTGPWR